MLNTLKALACGQLHVADFHVVLEIQPRFCAQRMAGPLRHQPDRRDRTFDRILAHRSLRAAFGIPCCFRRRTTRRPAVADRLCREEMPIGHACRHDEGLTISTRWRFFRVRAEHRLIGVPSQFATAMGPQMHHRGPAARHRYAIAADLFQHRTLARLRTKRHARDTLAALHLGDPFAHLDPDAQIARAVDQRAIGLRACINNRRYFQTGLFQNNRGAIGIVIVGHNDRAITNRDAKVHGIIADGRGQQYAGHIIRGKRQRALDRAGRGDGLFGTDTPQTMARAFAVGRVIGQAFVSQSIAVVIDPRRHAAQPHINIWHIFKSFRRDPDPFLRRHPINRRRIHNSAPTPIGRLLDQQDPRTALTSGLCRRKPCDAAAHNQNVNVAMEVFVSILIPILWCFAQTCRFADDRLVNMFPERTRVHEHLVIEPRRQEPRQM